MRTRQYFIAANWKMHGDSLLATAMQDAIAGLSYDHSAIETVICPPFTLLNVLHERDGLAVGAQNVHQNASGAYTGEISTAMLKTAGCRYVIVGHSERRELFAEDDALVASKFVAIAQAGLRPILCVGETLEQREQGVTESVLTAQLDAVISMTASADWLHAVIAYEPVWAIGTGMTATPEQAQTVHQFIRQYLAKQSVTADIADSVRIVYGGSVKPDNAQSLFAQADIDGGLIGGASLHPQDFTAIICAADGCVKE
ncbi:MAG: triose-phosphate isomerase [Arenicella sp.]